MRSASSVLSALLFASAALLAVAAAVTPLEREEYARCTDRVERRYDALLRRGDIAADELDRVVDARCCPLPLDADARCHVFD